MPETETANTELPAVTGAKRPPLDREESPVRWPSAATGSGAVYGVTDDSPTAHNDAAAEG